MSKRIKNKKGRQGQSRHNKQWVAEHRRHRARLWHGDTDKLTQETVK